MKARAEAGFSYRSLMAVRGFARLAASMVLARTAAQMWQLALVLFVLQKFRSPALAGLTVFFAAAPGIVVSPLAGALLDRHGRVGLILLDYVAAGLSLALIVALSITGGLAPALLLPIVAVSSLTYPLSNTGTRSLFPLMVPRELWDRANAVDSAAYAVTGIVGPALAGVLTAWAGGDIALLVTAAFFVLPALMLLGMAEVPPSVAAKTGLLSDAWSAVRYVLSNPTMRGLALSISVLNVGAGMLIVGLPVMIFQRLHSSAALVGELWALSGLASVVSVFFFGRLNSEGRERLMLAASMVAYAAGYLVVAFSSSATWAAAGMALGGLANGPLDLGIFSLRQRRTDPAWFGRAFAVSMSLNFSGIPVGAALCGPLVSFSIPLALGLGAAISALAGLVALAAIPKGSRPAELSPA